MNSFAFKVVHVETGLTLGQHKEQHPLRYFDAAGELVCDDRFRNRRLRPILRNDGAVGFQVKPDMYYAADLYFLVRKDWNVVFRIREM